MVGNQAKSVTETMEEGHDPFRRRDSLARTPPPRERARSISEIPPRIRNHPGNTETKAERLEREENLAFEALGKNLEIIDKIVKDARNIHKQIRDATFAAMIYYQRLKKAREGRAKMSSEHRGKISDQKNAAVQTEDRDGGQKRGATSPIETPRQEKRTRPKTAPSPNEAANDVKTASERKEGGDPAWQTVDHRKKKRKRSSEQANGQTHDANARNVLRTRKMTSEAVAVKIAEEKSYSSVKDL